MAIRLEPQRLRVEQLMLDPNNPRYADLDVTAAVPDTRVTEDGVQDMALARMLEPRFDVEQLKESIQNLGFLPTDQLVVVELRDDKFKVIEGNRRAAAVKSLLEDHQAGHVSLTEGVAATLDPLPCLVIRGSVSEREHYARLLQGLRHVPGVKQWGPYQQAQFVGLMLADGRPVQEVREMLGLSAQRVNSLRRVQLAMAQMRQSDEYAEYARPALFSQFEEALKIPAVREWLEWDNDQGEIANSERRDLFYGWIVGVEDEEGQRHPKVLDAKDFRQLPAVLEDSRQSRRFLEDPRLTLREAARGLPEPEPDIDWRALLRGNLHSLRQVPAVQLVDATEADVDLLHEVKAACDILLSQIEAGRETRG
jgi:hypothetical protein